MAFTSQLPVGGIGASAPSPAHRDLALDDVVRVRLTDHGREILALQNRALELPPAPPEEDAEGWSPWPLRELMERFGDFLDPGQEAPFDPVIRIAPQEARSGPRVRPEAGPRTSSAATGKAQEPPAVSWSTPGGYSDGRP